MNECTNRTYISVDAVDSGRISLLSEDAFGAFAFPTDYVERVCQESEIIAC